MLMLYYVYVIVIYDDMYVSNIVDILHLVVLQSWNYGEHYINR